MILLTLQWICKVGFWVDGGVYDGGWASPQPVKIYKVEICLNFVLQAGAHVGL